MPYFAAQFESTDPQEIEERMRSRSVRTEIRGRLHYCASFRGDETFTLGRSATSAAMQVECTPADVTITYTNVSSPWISGRSSGDLGVGPVLFGVDRTHWTGSDGKNAATSVTFDRGRVKAFTRAYFGPDVRVHLHEAGPAGPRASLWRRLTDLIAASPLEYPLVRANAYRALAFAVCDTFSVVDDRRSASTTARSRHRQFLRAADYLEAHAAQAIGVDDAAKEADVSVQELRRLFLAFAPLGRSPEQHLRQCRLEGAHQELLHAAPASTSVKAVALRWGFAYPATFVRLHLERYGQLPHLLLG